MLPLIPASEISSPYLSACLATAGLRGDRVHTLAHFGIDRRTGAAAAFALLGSGRLSLPSLSVNSELQPCR